MTAVAITGASGSVGRVAIDALDGHTVTLFSHSETEDLPTTPIEIADRTAFHEALEGQDVLLHLAANPSPDAAWDDLTDPNIQGAYNAYEAAIENGLDRVIFASSNHAVNMENVVTPNRPESTVEQPTVVRPDDPPNPDTYYGVTKVFGEAIGSLYARQEGLEVINLRIGWLLTADELVSVCENRDDAGARFASAMWLSPADCRRLIKSAVESSIEETPVTAHGISANTNRFLSLAETTHRLGYEPRDNADEVLKRNAASR